VRGSPALAAGIRVGPALSRLESLAAGIRVEPALSRLESLAAGIRVEPALSRLESRLSAGWRAGATCIFRGSARSTDVLKDHTASRVGRSEFRRR